ncbi:MAG: hypothetical protein HY327_07390 [Chloroflexi bacterium]|nr:hypothetical protein [Chloroflexota bacterium]
MQESHPITLISPPPGFVERVMARVQERERADARRRALIGAGVFAVGVAGLSVWIAAWIGVDLGAFNPIETFTMLATTAPFDLTALADALPLAAAAILTGWANLPVLPFALGALGLTWLWLRVANLSPQIISLRGVK